jgi:hypothetical protein
MYVVFCFAFFAFFFQTTKIVSQTMTDKNSFPGLMLTGTALSERCWLDSRFLLLTSEWKISSVLLLVDTVEKKNTKIKLPSIAWKSSSSSSSSSTFSYGEIPKDWTPVSAETTGVSLVDIDGSHALITMSCPIHPSAVYVLSFDKDSLSKSPSYKFTQVLEPALSQDENIVNGLKSLSYYVIPHSAPVSVAWLFCSFRCLISRFLFL